MVLRHNKIFKLKYMRHAFHHTDWKKQGAGDLEMDAPNRYPWEKLIIVLPESDGPTTPKSDF
jgi:hypothetical protein